jgi:hypothetical protein
LKNIGDIIKELEEIRKDTKRNGERLKELEDRTPKKPSTPRPEPKPEEPKPDNPAK